MLSVEPSFFLLHPLSLSRVRVWFSDFKQPHFCLKLWKMPWHIWILSDAARGVAVTEGEKLAREGPEFLADRAPRAPARRGATARSYPRDR